MADETPTYPLTPEGVTAALNALPVGSEDIAMRFTELGIKGQRDNDCACPVAAYLLRVVSDAEYVQVGGEAAYIKGIVRETVAAGFIQSFDARLSVNFSDAVSAFVEDFDAGMYPDLIEVTHA